MFETNIQSDFLLARLISRRDDLHTCPDSALDELGAADEKDMHWLATVGTLRAKAVALSRTPFAALSGVPTPGEFALIVSILCDLVA